MANSLLYQQAQIARRYEHIPPEERVRMPRWWMWKYDPYKPDEPCQHRLFEGQAAIDAALADGWSGESERHAKSIANERIADVQDQAYALERKAIERRHNSMPVTASLEPDGAEAVPPAEVSSQASAGARPKRKRSAAEIAADDAKLQLR